MGKSKKWQEAIKVVSDGKMTTLEAQPLLDYFEPLFKWLKNANKVRTCGWGDRRRVF